MSSALSSAYVLLGKATMSDPPDWSTAVGAIHSLSSLLSCSICSGVVGPRPLATPNDSYSLVCDKCDVKPTDQGNILKGTVIWTVRRQGVESTKRVFVYILFSVTQFS